MTKAERIYKHTKWACEDYIKAWGFDKEVGFNGLVLENEEDVYKRTVTEIKKYAEKDVLNYKNGYRVGVYTKEEYLLGMQAIQMVLNTLKNQYISKSL